jgi:alpha-beta hydrolase superfamily lysophospholipase
MDIENLKRDIPPLDFTQQVFRSPEQQEYFRHYKLDFEDHYPELQHFFGSIDSGDYQLACHYYRSPAPKGCCFIFHGYYDHAGLFSRLIEFCIQRQLSVVIYDLPGHGLSSGERVSINDFADYQRVLDDVLERFEGELPDPWYGIAQSTGAAVLMGYLLDNPQSIFTKTVLLAPLVRPRSWSSISMLATVLRLFGRQFPRWASNCSNDESFKQFIAEQDPLQSPTISLAWLVALKKWMKRFLLHKPCEHGPLVVQGKKDSTVDWLYNVGVIKKKFPKGKIVYLETARHHLANENDVNMAKLSAQLEKFLLV